jgi:hypothetical protein
MRRIFVHVGMHKTGTTSIQETLSAALNDGSKVYAKLHPYANHSVPIAALFSQSGHRHHVYRRRGWSAAQVEAEAAELRRQLTEGFDAHADADFIISGEGIVGLSQHELEQFREFLHQFFEDIIICAYIRPPKQYMESTFQENLKNGMGGFRIAHLFPNYRARFEKFEVVFGRDQMRLWKFDTGSFPGGCVVRDFCRRLGIEIPEAHIVRVNEGLSLAAITLLYAHRRYGSGFGVGGEAIRQNRELMRMLRRIDGPKLRFCSTLVRGVLEERHEDIVWMEARLGATLREDFQDRASATVTSEADLLRPDPVALAQWMDLVMHRLRRLSPP